MTKTPIRKVSRRRARENRERTKCLEVVRARSKGYCEARIQNACTSIARDGHEPQRRAAADITDPDQVMHVCPGCHRWIDGNQAAAYAFGLLVSKNGPVFSMKAYLESKKCVATIRQYIARSESGSVRDVFAQDDDSATQKACELFGTEFVTVRHVKNIKTYSMESQ